MEFEKYNPEEHGEEVPEVFSGVVRKPIDSGRYRKVIEKALDDVEKLLGIEAEFDVVIGELDLDRLDDEGELPDHAYFRGYSLGVGVQPHVEKDAIFLATTDQYEYWKAGLKTTTVHEEAHQEFYVRKRDLDHIIWESMVFEGHAKVRERRVRNQKNYQWMDDPREYQGSAEKLKDQLERKRHWQGEKYNNRDSSKLFTFESEFDGIGYVVAREVYENILDRNEMSVDEPLEKSWQWMREQVDRSIERIYT